MENLSFVAHMTMEKHIIERLKLGDEKAFKYIYDCHYVLLCRFAYQLLDDSSLSEEVVDDAIFYLWEHRPQPLRTKKSHPTIDMQNGRVKRNGNHIYI